MNHGLMTKTSLYLFSLLLLSTALYSETADEILQKMDDHNKITNSFEMIIRVENYKNNELDDTTLMKGTMKDGKVAAIDYLEPSSMKGRKIVVKDNDMWIIIPKTKNPIKISASQRLMGGISYSDIARVSYSDGYQPKLIEETTIEGKTPDGKKSEPKNCYLLELTAKEPGASYQKINMWVEKESYLPIKADFYSLSGKKMLTSYFTLPQDWNGKTVITKIFLYDQVITSKFSIMEYSNMQMINQSTNGIEDNTNN